MSKGDRKNVKDASNFALAYTTITTLSVALLCALGMGVIAAIPFLGALIDGVLLVCVIVFAVIHLAIAWIIDWYFGLARGGRSKIGYGYYAQRIGAGQGHGRTLEKDPGKRIELFIGHSALIASITLLSSALLGCLALGVISMILNSLLLLQRVIYTPKRAKHLK